MTSLTAADEMFYQVPSVKVEMAPIPKPVAVTLESKRTVLLISDVLEKMRVTQPDKLRAIEQAVSALLVAARGAGARVVYTCQQANHGTWLPSVAPLPEDLYVASRAQDRFHGTSLHEDLSQRGIDTIILTGWKVSGSLLYTAVAATLWGYRVVVPVDATSSPSDFETALGLYQMLNQMHGNLTNEPLKARAPTLSRSDLITFA